jgi:hypothetical protein
MTISLKKAFPVLAVILLGLYSCNESSIIGLDVQPDSDKVNVLFNDTSTIQAFSVKEDSVKSDENSVNLIVSYVDPIFGYAEASVYTQVLPKTASPDFGTSPVADSIVLQLAYTNAYYGKKDPQTFNVYEVTERFYLAPAYYSNKSFSYSPTPLGTITFTPNNTDSITINNVKTAPHLRIKLSAAFANNLLSGGANLADSTVFFNFLKGLYIQPSNPSQVTGEGGIFAFNLLDPVSKLTLYYSNAADDSLSYDFVINTNCARVGHFSHNYSSASAGLQAELSDSTLGQNSFYIQSMSGLKGKVKFPYLKNLLLNQNVIINKAEVVFKVDQFTLDTVDPSSRLVLLAIDSLGHEIATLDQLYNPTLEVYGGAYSNQQYTFNISRHIQFLLKGHKDYGFYLIAAGGAVTANRVVLGGPVNPLYKMKLNLTYTKLN